MRRRRLATTPLGVGRSATRVDHQPAPSKERTYPRHHARTHRSRRRKYRGHRGGYAVIIPAIYGATDFLRCHLSFGNQPGGCQEHPVVFASIAIGGAVLGMIIALALRARFAAYWWAVFAAFTTVGSVW